MELLQEADCVIAVGASLNHYTTEHGYLYPRAKFIQIDTAPHVVMGNGSVADCYVQADAGIALDALTARWGNAARGGRVPHPRGAGRLTAALDRPGRVPQ